MFTDVFVSMIDQAKLDMDYAFSRWNLADREVEDDRWRAYQDAVARYRLLLRQVRDAQASTGIQLPWLAG